DAYARWAAGRLPTEFEWEVAAAAAKLEGNFVESERFHPARLGAASNGTPSRMFGDVWEWTCSAYSPYRATGRWRARSASTMGNSCAGSSFCAEVPARLRPRTSDRPTATSFHLRLAGSSPRIGRTSASFGFPHLNGRASQRFRYRCVMLTPLPSSPRAWRAYTRKALRKAEFASSRPRPRWPARTKTGTHKETA